MSVFFSALSTVCRLLKTPPAVCSLRGKIQGKEECRLQSEHKPEAIKSQENVKRHPNRDVRRSLHVKTTRFSRLYMNQLRPPSLRSYRRVMWSRFFFPTLSLKWDEILTIKQISWIINNWLKSLYTRFSVKYKSCDLDSKTGT